MFDFNQILEAQSTALKDYWKFWEHFQGVLAGEKPNSFIQPSMTDKRFKSDDWANNPIFYFYQQVYLMFSQHCMDFVGKLSMDPKINKQMTFFTQQMLDALSPTNFVLTNPDVLKETLLSQGESLKKGFENFLEDWKRGEGFLNIKMTDLNAFQVGKNVAATPGKVVFQNNLMQLIQYSPSTENVYQIPLLMIPPWINKYYILDLSERNSLVKWAVDQGLTVFMISWVNPDQSHRDCSFQEYIQDGLLAAIDSIEEITHHRQLNALGFCIGGTLLSMGLSYLQKLGDECIQSATFLATLIDFSEPGDIGVFIDEHQISQLEKMMDNTGFLNGQWMMSTFNSLRANELLWNYYINNYLCGKKPFPFDLLYWNSDCTNLPQKLHSDYLRNMYLENRLCHPNALSVSGVPIDLSKVGTPAYFISTLQDHIAPWETTYKGAQCLGGPKTFVLSGSGHIAGIINPPANQKYGYHTLMESTKFPDNPQDWLAHSQENTGSWWDHWIDWLRRYSGKRVEPRIPGMDALSAIENAPGSYVMQQWISIPKS